MHDPSKKHREEKEKDYEYLKSTELDTEQNYNQIDGVRNNLKPEKEETPSILESLKEEQEAIKKADQQGEKKDRCPAKDEDCR